MSPTLGRVSWIGLTDVSHRPDLHQVCASDYISPCLHQTNAISKSITIRDVPDATSAESAARAAATGRSLQEYLRSRLVELADAPDTEVWVSRVRARNVATSGLISANRLLTRRDADRT